MKYLSFAVGALSASVLVSGMVATITSDSYQFWPPGDDALKFQLYRSCSLTFVLSLIVTGYLDWNAGPLPWPTSAVGGGILFVVGLAIAREGGVDLGIAETRGQVGELQTDGIYRYSRNPQTIGYAIVFASGALLSNSILVAILAVFGGAWLFLAILAEEPWLREQYGEAYDNYFHEVPRFVGLRSITRAQNDDE
jgi:protein-S-isoprenylcysteine O-methyltransferase Ste14